MSFNKHFSSGIEPIKYLFIDGGSLDSVLATFSKELFGDRELEINYYHLAKGYQKVFYYDCLPVKKEGENELAYKSRIKPKIELFNHLKSLDRFHVYEGTARFRDKNKGQEQKQVDIMIAVDMLTHSFRRNMQEATLLTGDLDFKPLIDALVQDGMHVELWYPKGKANYELVDAADSRKPLTIGTVQHWFTKSFQSKMNLPDTSQVQNVTLGMEWSEIVKIEKKTYSAFFYENKGLYAAVVPNKDGGNYLHRHDDLNQLKFYVEHLYGLDIYRPNDF
ncbi:hypothetical protein C7H19_18320 [Aphanothece hegewaldii CCALA 016]|uniref:NYN domain-containing protein n=1 Tax=Aphanothece hegewaldii CCALA 016 TaxID=2107694 RepID=A0A2T1LU40_9CHRO|nr:NYN domain-containing protein [Aphanothece hegewaldii]PSF34960.1 hypothetical protein C7H19_18320 [Aphanothece hegewaldii CCALA 016]